MSISKDTSGRLQAIAVRNIEFYRPEPGDIPWDLLVRGSAHHSLEKLEQILDMDYTRVANRIEPAATIGVYSMQCIDAERFELISVAVAPEVEHQLVWRRLLGHALGLAESKAAREVALDICADNLRALDTAERYGFARREAPNASGSTSIPTLTSTLRTTLTSTVALRFELTPE